MTSYVPSVEQLVVEIFVRDAKRAKSFYERLGFQITEDRGTFVVLTWEGHELFLDERPDLPLPARVPQANVRVMVSDVDAYWDRARGMNATVVAAISDREYGLRDFTILDPDGFGIRFGSRLQSSDAHADCCRSVPARPRDADRLLGSIRSLHVRRCSSAPSGGDHRHLFVRAGT
jgi:catechol 2,3-dioxygenase-like lactoylglutathione lyase family enzyme